LLLDVHRSIGSVTVRQPCASAAPPLHRSFDQLGSTANTIDSVITADDPQLVSAVERVRHDVEATLGNDALTIEISAGGSPEVAIATIEVDPSLTGLYVHPGESEAQLVTRLSDTVQDCVAESGERWGLAWPSCPDPSHRHPLSAPYSSPGMWVCPASGTAIAPIGRLPPP
jgi:hypothetical protein